MAEEPNAIALLEIGINNLDKLEAKFRNSSFLDKPAIAQVMATQTITCFQKILEVLKEKNE